MIYYLKKIRTKDGAVIHNVQNPFNFKVLKINWLLVHIVIYKCVRCAIGKLIQNFRAIKWIKKKFKIGKTNRRCNDAKSVK